MCVSVYPLFVLSLLVVEEIGLGPRVETGTEGLLCRTQVRVAPRGTAEHRLLCLALPREGWKRKACFALDALCGQDIARQCLLCFVTPGRTRLNRAEPCVACFALIGVAVQGIEAQSLL
jgi:hypothetical protein